MSIALPGTLLFIRHAIAADAEEFPGPDAERPLVRKGIKKARKAFRGLCAHYRPTRIVASNLVRARETAELLRESLLRFGEPPAIETISALAPEGEWTAWVEALARIDPPFTSQDVVAVVGHEPSLGHLFARHLGLPPGTSLPFKKAGVGILACDAAAALTAMRLVAFIPAKML